MDRIFLRQRALSLLLAQSLVVSSIGLPANAATRSEPGQANLEVLELQLYGKKFQTLPVESRLVRLEKRMGTQPPARGGSVNFRVAELNRVGLAQVSESSKRSAVRLYNQAIDEVARGQIDEAIRLYGKALEQHPAFLEAGNNLASLLEQQKRDEEALEVYRQIIRHHPEQPLPYRNIGVIYERMGNIREAIRQYKTYLELTPSPDPPIQSIVENYNVHRGLAGNGQDYVAVTRSATEGRQLVWPVEAMPVPVFVEIAEPGHVHFLPEIRDSMRQWEEAAAGKLRFREFSRPPERGIVISFNSGPLSHPQQNVGHASFEADHEATLGLSRLKIHITLNVGSPEIDGLSLPQRKQQLARLALHELGHAIGIWGHSPNPDDVMFTRPIVSELSERDLKTARKLYEGSR